LPNLEYTGTNARFPPIRCRFAVPVSRRRFRTPLPLLLPLRLRISIEPLQIDVVGYLMSLSRITTWDLEMWSLHLSEINNIMYAVKTLYALPWLVGVDDWLASNGTTAIETRKPSCR